MSRCQGRGYVSPPGSRWRGAGEHIAATPVTGPDGRFKADLPSGPSRQVRARILVERYRGHRASSRPPRPRPPATQAPPAPRCPQRPPGPLQGPAPGAGGAAPVGSDPSAIGQALDRGEQRPHKPARCLPRPLPLPLDLGPPPVRLQGGRPEPAGLPLSGRALQNTAHNREGLRRAFVQRRRHCSCPAYPPCATLTGTPWRGTSVMPRITTGSAAAAAGRSSARETTMRITSAISAWASAAPMQRRMPPPNGSHA